MIASSESTCSRPCSLSFSAAAQRIPCGVSSRDFGHGQPSWRRKAWSRWPQPRPPAGSPGLGGPNVEPARRALPPAPPPAGRRLDRARAAPALPLLGPARKTLPIGREARLDHLATLRIEHRRLKGVLVDVDRREQHHGPPHVDEARSSSTLRTEPYDIHLTGRDPVVPASFAPAGSVEAIRQRSKGG